MITGTSRAILAARRQEMLRDAVAREEKVQRLQAQLDLERETIANLRTEVYQIEGDLGEDPVFVPDPFGGESVRIY